MSARRKRILVLDASEFVLMNLERVLENSEFDTTTTWDMQEALRLLGERRFDLLLVGEHPPEVDAAEMLRQLQYNRLSAPAIILLPEVYPFAPEYFYSLGAAEVISKWHYGELAQHLQQRWAAPARAAAAGR